MRFKDLKIRTRLSIIIGGFVALAFIIFGITVSTNVEKRMLDTTDYWMVNQLDDIAQIVNLELQGNKEKVQLVLPLAHKYLQEQGAIEEMANEEITFSAINQESKAITNISVNAWYIGGKKLQNSTEFVDFLTSTGISTATIFQKTPLGYLRISTNVRNADGSRAIGTYIPFTSPVVQAIEKGEAYSGRAWVVNDWYVTAYEPITFDGEIKGMLYVGIPEKNLPQLSSLINSKRFFSTGYAYMVASDGTLLIHPNSVGSSIKDENFFHEMLNNKSGQVFRQEYVWQGEKKVQYVKYLNNLDVFISTNFYEKEMNAELIHLRLVVFVAVFFWAIISVIILQFVLRPVVNALRTGVNLAKQVSQGDLTAKVNIYQRDEIGELADALRGMVSQLSQMAMTIKTTAEGIAGASNEVNSASQQLSQGASEQASSVEEVSSSMEEMAANIQQTTDNARHSEKVVEKALEEIGKLAHAGNDSLASIKAIAEKINIINDIAFQTNILALNAAVEAARAGEQGKGFAVVAAEVRKLAERSKIAADEIVSLAATSVHYTELASEAMGRVAPEIANTVKLTQEIAAASAEQSAGTDQINSAIQQLNHVTQQNAAASEEMATSAEELSSQAEQLREVIGFFKLDATSTGKSYVKTEQKKIEKKGTAPGKPEELKTAKEQPKKGIVLRGFSSDTGDTEYEHF